MEPSGNIEHKGVVKDVTGDSVKVIIQSGSACSSCHAKGICGASEMQDKIIEVSSRNIIFNKGEPVNVLLKKSEGYKALLYGYILPLVILLLTLVIAQSIFSNELIAGLFSVGVLLPYYTVLYFLRNRLKRSFHFVLQKLDTDL